MSSEHTMNPTGGVLSRRVMEEAPSQSQLLERILSNENIGKAWMRVRANKGAPGIDARTLAAQTGMTNKWLYQNGLISVKEQWVKIHYPVTAR
ncbi:MAG: hypothetical protein ABIJ50_01220 [Pseudomonadota bacterium]